MARFARKLPCSSRFSVCSGEPVGQFSRAWAPNQRGEPRYGIGKTPSDKPPSAKPAIYSGIHHGYDEATKALMPPDSRPVWIKRQTSELGLDVIAVFDINPAHSPDMKKAARGKSRLFQACLSLTLASARRVINAVNCAGEERIEIPVALLCRQAFGQRA